VGQDTQHGRDTNVLAQDTTDAGDLKLSNVALRRRPVELKKVNRSRHKLNQCSMKKVNGGSEPGRDNEEYYLCPVVCVCLRKVRIMFWSYSLIRLESHCEQGLN
jgi:hypothetical protein